MAVYGKVLAQGSIGHDEKVTVPFYPGEENPGSVHFAGSYALTGEPGGGKSRLIRYSFALAAGLSHEISVNRNLAQKYADAGSKTAQAALIAAAKLSH